MVMQTRVGAYIGIRDLDHLVPVWITWKERSEVELSGYPIDSDENVPLSSKQLPIRLTATLSASYVKGGTPTATWLALLRLQRDSTFVTAFTTTGVYENLLIEGLETQVDAEGSTSEITLDLRQIEVANAPAQVGAALVSRLGTERIYSEDRPLNSLRLAQFSGAFHTRY